MAVGLSGAAGPNVPSHAAEEYALEGGSVTVLPRWVRAASAKVSELRSSIATQTTVQVCSHAMWLEPKLSRTYSNQQYIDK